jgi:signal transduction histidine kinase
MRRLIGRLRSASLGAQMVVLLLLALGVSQATGFFIYRNERTEALRGMVADEFVSRAASVAQLLEATPPDLHQQILDAVATTYTRYWLGSDEPTDVAAWQRQARQHLAEGAPPARPPWRTHAPQLGAGFLAGAPASAAGHTAWEILPASAWPLARPAKLLRLDHAYALGLAVALDGGGWLNAAYAKPLSADWSSQAYVSLAIMAGAISLIAWLTAHRIARPLRQLACAVERLGRGEEVAPLGESGPRDIRQTAEAFNRMQSRLRRFIEDRTRMLAALGHDLRTPITALRLRAEFVSDPGVRDKLLVTLDEMQAMAETALTFARQESAGEPTRTIDLTALLESMCEDLADLGCDISFANGERIPYRCRPEALRRAVRNLIQNAVRYGERARVALRRGGGAIEVVVDDDGPGIPAAEFERVFQPFVRLEGSRNRATGGVGLGLSIARTIARDHGGDITLANRPGGGLRATILLPGSLTATASHGARPRLSAVGDPA